MTNVRFLPFRPTEEIPYVLASADLHIVTMGQGLEGLVVPSKLYPILMAHKPVLAVAPLESDLARIVEEHQCGLVVGPDDPEGVAKAILWARKHSQDDLAAMGRRAGEASILFDRRRLLKEFVRSVELASTR
jgi:glycosyltransferase involved in cell wall biosynthesis